MSGEVGEGGSTGADNRPMIILSLEMRLVEDVYNEIPEVNS